MSRNQPCGIFSPLLVPRVNSSLAYYSLEVLVTYLRFVFWCFSPFCQVTRSASWTRIFFKLSFTSPKLLLRFFVLLDGCACPARSGCFGRLTESWPWPASTRRTGYPKPWSASCRSTSCLSSATGTGIVPILFIALVLAVFLSCRS